VSLPKLGEPVRWISERRGQETTVEGKLIAIKLVDSVMRTPRGEFPALRFQIRDALGRAHWTCSFADEEGRFAVPFEHSRPEELLDSERAMP
jgi:hypothetical protein